MIRSRLCSPKFIFLVLIAICVWWLVPINLFSQSIADPAAEKTARMLQEFNTFKGPSLVTQAVALTLMALLPFIIMILTAFIKIVVVLSLLRNALGAQQAPPNQVVNGIAFLLSIYIMFPTMLQMYTAAEDLINSENVPTSIVDTNSSEFLITVAKAASEPYREYLMRNVIPDHQRSFYRMTYKILPIEYRAELSINDFIVLIPTYIASQLKVAFEVGALIYIPFFVIDLVTANILLAMGMMMLSPVTISMPLKLFLLVMLDGWTLLVQGLVATFK
ncbi:MAG: type III secretion system export apparatus subunit SctR [Waddliaceae bacterium]|jgi:type III secretion protein R|nr:type III secretion system export apparatus subunit SctR [Waddliaceae bacterium]MBT3579349.1 type III secretion system export apparatus subunit SctR [Waddliaceae bacterium]MBT4444839.1 type III secretion system export apparatus subunit SctR [Waddliaceae bacterium]MBT6928025.1 type III secretion system export apparatus subunit SctR [Waddliaceae bacterium]MBT7264299.1 type III secretion system export apparatus subunit SctR [Waddliaceae bacterium]